MTELHWYLLFLVAWVFMQSLWLSKLAKQVAQLSEQLAALESKRKP